MRWTVLGALVGTLGALYARGVVSFGGLVLNKAALEQRRREGKPVDTIHFGGVVIADDVSPELAAETIRRFKVFGGFVAPRSVMDAAGNRINVTGGKAVH